MKNTLRSQSATPIPSLAKALGQGYRFTISSTISLAMVLSSMLGAADFRTDILPILTKAGCNSGACHGAAIGRGGFQLSLYGQDADRDFKSIVYQLDGRRVNFVDPMRSLLLRKPGGQVEHEGGERIDIDGPNGQTILAWISAGCQIDNEIDIRRLVVTPASHVLNVNQPVDITVDAVLTDGSTRGVTPNALFLPLDLDAVKLLKDVPGRVQVLSQGRHTVIVRYRDLVASVELIAPYQTNGLAAPSSNQIDRFVNRRLGQLGLAGQLAADANQIARRTYLSVLGRLPTPEEVRSFAESENTDRVPALVDELLASAGFADYWSYWLAASLRASATGNRAGRDLKALEVYRNWIHRQIELDQGLDEICNDLLLATGDSHLNGATGFYRSSTGAREQAELFAETMIGARLRCANCHNHPLDRWTQDDYHGLAAIFAGIGHGKVIQWALGRQVIHPRTKTGAIAKLPDGARLIVAAEDPRPRLAHWLSDDNPYFTKNWANRIWAALMGRGLVEPLEDMRDTNPPTHPQLLEWLAGQLKAHQFKLKPLIRQICSSDAFARKISTSSDSTAEDLWYASRTKYTLAAPILIDAIDDITMAPKWRKRWINRTDYTREIAQTDFDAGCTAEGACDPVIGRTASLADVLQWINGEKIDEAIRRPGGPIHRLLSADSSDQDVIDQLFMLTLARNPTKAELSLWTLELGRLKTGNERTAVLEDLCWSLLTCHEFSTNH